MAVCVSPARQAWPPSVLGRGGTRRGHGLPSALSERGSLGTLCSHILPLRPPRPRCRELAEAAAWSREAIAATCAPRFLQTSGTRRGGSPNAALLPSHESETARCPCFVTPWPREHCCHGRACAVWQTETR